ncbi:MAG: HesA/MoeB/ThiF family protein [Candidatus Heimdallarchaeota archaeon]|nr:HesA/MoeB/ThiF family protein [Candidatus Heimdallarchaeota archaeon]MBY8994112.1 HesA/MoeB/ThiF family protein [Candidatus Heimdallarchaeota archaeon]
MEKDRFLNSRYSRFAAIPSIGAAGVDKIRKAKVTIVGAGGLGSVTAPQLVALGVKYLRIIDQDVVELSNLQRQTMYRDEDIGKSKTLVAKKFLEELNPEVEIDVISESITKKNVHIATDSVDFVVDAVDRFAPRFALNKACLEVDIPYLFGAVSGMSGNAITVKRGSTCVECIFSQADDSKLPTSLEVGIHPSIINIIGSIQVSEATRIMLNEDLLLLNKLHFCDIGTMQFETLHVKTRDDCFCSNI